MAKKRTKKTKAKKAKSAVIEEETLVDIKELDPEQQIKRLIEKGKKRTEGAR